MFIHSLKKFEINPSNERYEKRVIFDNSVYIVSVCKDKWSSSTRRSINRWLKNNTNIEGISFPYGYIYKCIHVSVRSVKENLCEFCSIKCKSIQTKRRHMKSCKHKDTIPERPPDETNITTLENTRVPHQTIINNNNNITINNNIQICDFGNENQKWLTKDLLMCIYLDRRAAVKHLIRSKHFNDKFPENQNIRLDNKSNINRRLQVFSKGRWRVREAKPMIDLAFINTNEIISDLLNIEDDDDTSYDDDHQTQVIRDFQSTDKFRNMYNRLLQKWENLGECIKKEDTEFQEYWEYIKTLLLDHRLKMEQDAKRLADVPTDHS